MNQKDGEAPPLPSHSPDAAQSLLLDGVGSLATLTSSATLATLATTHRSNVSVPATTSSYRTSEIGHHHLQHHRYQVVASSDDLHSLSRDGDTRNDLTATIGTAHFDHTGRSSSGDGAAAGFSLETFPADHLGRTPPPAAATKSIVHAALTALDNVQSLLDPYLPPDAQEALLSWPPERALVRPLPSPRPHTPTATTTTAMTTATRYARASSPTSPLAPVCTPPPPPATPRASEHAAPSGRSSHITKGGLPHSLALSAPATLTPSSLPPRSPYRPPNGTTLTSLAKASGEASAPPATLPEPTVTADDERSERAGGWLTVAALNNDGSMTQRSSMVLPTPTAPTAPASPAASGKQPPTTPLTAWRRRSSACETGPGDDPSSPLRRPSVSTVAYHNSSTAPASPHRSHPAYTHETSSATAEVSSGGGGGASSLPPTHAVANHFRNRVGSLGGGGGGAKAAVKTGTPPPGPFVVTHQNGSFSLRSGALENRPADSFIGDVTFPGGTGAASSNAAGRRRFSSLDSVESVDGEVTNNNSSGERRLPHAPIGLPAWHAVEGSTVGSPTFAWPRSEAAPQNAFPTGGAGPAASEPTTADRPHAPPHEEEVGTKDSADSAHRAATQKAHTGGLPEVPLPPSQRPATTTTTTATTTVHGGVAAPLENTTMSEANTRSSFTSNTLTTNTFSIAAHTFSSFATSRSGQSGQSERIGFPSPEAAGLSRIALPRLGTSPGVASCANSSSSSSAASAAADEGDDTLHNADGDDASQAAHSSSFTAGSSAASSAQASHTGGDAMLDVRSLYTPAFRAYQRRRQRLSMTGHLNTLICRVESMARLCQRQRRAADHPSPHTHHHDSDDDDTQLLLEYTRLYLRDVQLHTAAIASPHAADVLMARHRARQYAAMEDNLPSSDDLPQSESDDDDNTSSTRHDHTRRSRRGHPSGLTTLPPQPVTSAPSSGPTSPWLPGRAPPRTAPSSSSSTAAAAAAADAVGGETPVLPFPLPSSRALHSSSSSTSVLSQPAHASIPAEVLLSIGSSSIPSFSLRWSRTSSPHTHSHNGPVLTMPQPHPQRPHGAAANSAASAGAAPPRPAYTTNSRDPSAAVPHLVFTNASESSVRAHAPYNHGEGGSTLHGSGGDYHLPQSLRPVVATNTAQTRPMSLATTVSAVHDHADRRPHGLLDTPPPPTAPAHLTVGTTSDGTPDETAHADGSASDHQPNTAAVAATRRAVPAVGVVRAAEWCLEPPPQQTPSATRLTAWAASHPSSSNSSRIGATTTASGGGGGGAEVDGVTSSALSPPKAPISRPPLSPVHTPRGSPDTSPRPTSRYRRGHTGHTPTATVSTHSLNTPSAGDESSGSLRPSGGRGGHKGRADTAHTTTTTTASAAHDGADGPPPSPPAVLLPPPSLVKEPLESLTPSSTQSSPDSTSLPHGATAHDGVHFRDWPAKPRLSTEFTPFLPPAPYVPPIAMAAPARIRAQEQAPSRPPPHEPDETQQVSGTSAPAAVAPVVSTDTGRDAEQPPETTVAATTAGGTTQANTESTPRDEMNAHRTASTRDDGDGGLEGGEATDLHRDRDEDEAGDGLHEEAARASADGSSGGGDAGDEAAHRSSSSPVAAATPGTSAGPAPTSPTSSSLLPLPTTSPSYPWSNPSRHAQRSSSLTVLGLDANPSAYLSLSSVHSAPSTSAVALTSADDPTQAEAPSLPPHTLVQHRRALPLHPNQTLAAATTTAGRDTTNSPNSSSSSQMTSITTTSLATPLPPGPVTTTTTTTDHSATTATTGTHSPPHAHESESSVLPSVVLPTAADRPGALDPRDGSASGSEELAERLDQAIMSTRSVDELPSSIDADADENTQQLFLLRQGVPLRIPAVTLKKRARLSSSQRTRAAAAAAAAAVAAAAVARAEKGSSIGAPDGITDAEADRGEHSPLPAAATTTAVPDATTPSRQPTVSSPSLSSSSGALSTEATAALGEPRSRQSAEDGDTAATTTTTSPRLGWQAPFIVKVPDSVTAAAAAAAVEVMDPAQSSAAVTTTTTHHADGSADEPEAAPPQWPASPALTQQSSGASEDVVSRQTTECGAIEGHETVEQAPHGGSKDAERDDADDDNDDGNHDKTPRPSPRDATAHSPISLPEYPPMIVATPSDGALLVSSASLAASLLAPGSTALAPRTRSPPSLLGSPASPAESGGAVASHPTSSSAPRLRASRHAGSSTGISSGTFSTTVNTENSLLSCLTGTVPDDGRMMVPTTTTPTTATTTPSTTLTTITAASAPMALLTTSPGRVLGSPVASVVSGTTHSTTTGTTTTGSPTTHHLISATSSALPTAVTATATPPLATSTSPTASASGGGGGLSNPNVHGATHLSVPSGSTTEDGVGARQYFLGSVSTLTGTTVTDVSLRSTVPTTTTSAVTTAGAAANMNHTHTSTSVADLPSTGYLLSSLSTTTVSTGVETPSFLSRPSPHARSSMAASTSLMNSAVATVQQPSLGSYLYDMLPGMPPVPTNTGLPAAHASPASTGSSRIGTPRFMNSLAAGVGGGGSGSNSGGNHAHSYGMNPYLLHGATRPATAATSPGERAVEDTPSTALLLSHSSVGGASSGRASLPVAMPPGPPPSGSCAPLVMLERSAGSAAAAALVEDSYRPASRAAASSLSFTTPQYTTQEEESMAEPRTSLNPLSINAFPGELSEMGTQDLLGSPGGTVVSATTVATAYGVVSPLQVDLGPAIAPSTTTTTSATTPRASSSLCSTGRVRGGGAATTVMSMRPDHLNLRRSSSVTTSSQTSATPFALASSTGGLPSSDGTALTGHDWQSMVRPLSTSLGGAVSSLRTTSPLTNSGSESARLRGSSVSTSSVSLGVLESTAAGTGTVAAAVADTAVEMANVTAAGAAPTRPPHAHPDTTAHAGSDDGAIPLVAEPHLLQPPRTSTGLTAGSSSASSLHVQAPQTPLGSATMPASAVSVGDSGDSASTVTAASTAEGGSGTGTETSPSCGVAPREAKPRRSSTDLAVPLASSAPVALRGQPEPRRPSSTTVAGHVPVTSSTSASTAAATSTSTTQDSVWVSPSAPSVSVSLSRSPASRAVAMDAPASTTRETAPASGAEAPLPPSLPFARLITPTSPPLSPAGRSAPTMRSGGGVAVRRRSPTTTTPTLTSDASAETHLDDDVRPFPEVPSPKLTTGTHARRSPSAPRMDSPRVVPGSSSSLPHQTAVAMTSPRQDSALLPPSTAPLSRPTGDTSATTITTGATTSAAAAVSPLHEQERRAELFRRTRPPSHSLSSRLSTSNTPSTTATAGYPSGSSHTAPEGGLPSGRQIQLNLSLSATGNATTVLEESDAESPVERPAAAPTTTNAVTTGGPAQSLRPTAPHTATATTQESPAPPAHGAVSDAAEPPSSSAATANDLAASPPTIAEASPTGHRTEGRHPRRHPRRLAATSTAVITAASSATSHGAEAAARRSQDRAGAVPAAEGDPARRKPHVGSASHGESSSTGSGGASRPVVTLKLTRASLNALAQLQQQQHSAAPESGSEDAPLRHAASPWLDGGADLLAHSHPAEGPPSVVIDDEDDREPVRRPEPARRVEVRPSLGGVMPGTATVVPATPLASSPTPLAGTTETPLSPSPHCRAEMVSAAAPDVAAATTTTIVGSLSGAAPSQVRSTPAETHDDRASAAPSSSLPVTPLHARTTSAERDSGAPTEGTDTTSSTVQASPAPAVVLPKPLATITTAATNMSKTIESSRGSHHHHHHRHHALSSHLRAPNATVGSTGTPGGSPLTVASAQGSSPASPLLAQANDASGLLPALPTASPTMSTVYNTSMATPTSAAIPAPLGVAGGTARTIDPMVVTVSTFTASNLASTHFNMTTTSSLLSTNPGTESATSHNVSTSLPPTDTARTSGSYVSLSERAVGNATTTSTAERTKSGGGGLRDTIGLVASTRPESTPPAVLSRSQETALANILRGSHDTANTGKEQCDDGSACTGLRSAGDEDDELAEENFVRTHGFGRIREAMAAVMAAAEEKRRTADTYSSPLERPTEDPAEEGLRSRMLSAPASPSAHALPPATVLPDTTVPSSDDDRRTAQRRDDTTHPTCELVGAVTAPPTRTAHSPGTPGAPAATSPVVGQLTAPAAAALTNPATRHQLVAVDVEAGAEAVEEMTTETGVDEEDSGTIRVVTSTTDQSSVSFGGVGGGSTATPTTANTTTTTSAAPSVMVMAMRTSTDAVTRGSLTPTPSVHRTSSGVVIASLSSSSHRGGSATRPYSATVLDRLEDSLTTAFESSAAAVEGSLHGHPPLSLPRHVPCTAGRSPSAGYDHTPTTSTPELAALSPHAIQLLRPAPLCPPRTTALTAATAPALTTTTATSSVSNAATAASSFSHPNLTVTSGVTLPDSSSSGLLGAQPSSTQGRSRASTNSSLSAGARAGSVPGSSDARATAGTTTNSSVSLAPPPLAHQNASSHADGTVPPGQRHHRRHSSPQTTATATTTRAATATEASMTTSQSDDAASPPVRRRHTAVPPPLEFFASQAAQELVERVVAVASGPFARTRSPPITTIPSSHKPHARRLTRTSSARSLESPLPFAVSIAAEDDSTPPTRSDGADDAHAPLSAPPSSPDTHRKPHAAKAAWAPMAMPGYDANTSDEAKSPCFTIPTPTHAAPHSTTTAGTPTASSPSAGTLWDAVAAPNTAAGSRHEPHLAGLADGTTTGDDAPRADTTTADKRASQPPTTATCASDGTRPDPRADLIAVPSSSSVETGPEAADHTQSSSPSVTVSPMSMATHRTVLVSSTPAVPANVNHHGASPGVGGGGGLAATAASSTGSCATPGGYSPMTSMNSAAKRTAESGSSSSSTGAVERLRQPRLGTSVRRQGSLDRRPVPAPSATQIAAPAGTEATPTAAPTGHTTLSVTSSPPLSTPLPNTTTTVPNDNTAVRETGADDGSLSALPQFVSHSEGSSPLASLHSPHSSPLAPPSRLHSAPSTQGTMSGSVHAAQPLSSGTHSSSVTVSTSETAGAKGSEAAPTCDRLSATTTAAHQPVAETETTATAPSALTATEASDRLRSPVGASHYSSFATVYQVSPLVSHALTADASTMGDSGGLVTVMRSDGPSRSDQTATVTVSSASTSTWARHSGTGDGQFLSALIDQDGGAVLRAVLAPDRHLRLTHHSAPNPTLSPRSSSSTATSTAVSASSPTATTDAERAGPAVGGTATATTRDTSRPDDTQPMLVAAETDAKVAPADEAARSTTLTCAAVAAEEAQPWPGSLTMPPMESDVLTPSKPLALPPPPPATVGVAATAAVPSSLPAHGGRPPTPPLPEVTVDTAPSRSYASSEETHPAVADSTTTPFADHSARTSGTAPPRGHALHQATSRTSERHTATHRGLSLSDAPAFSESHESSWHTQTYRPDSCAASEDERDSSSRQTSRDGASTSLFSSTAALCGSPSSSSTTLHGQPVAWRHTSPPPHGNASLTAPTESESDWPHPSIGSPLLPAVTTALMAHAASPLGIPVGISSHCAPTVTSTGRLTPPSTHSPMITTDDEKPPLPLPITEGRAAGGEDTAPPPPLPRDVMPAAVAPSVPDAATSAVERSSSSSLTQAPASVTGVWRAGRPGDRSSMRTATLNSTLSALRFARPRQQSSYFPPST